MTCPAAAADTLPVLYSFRRCPYAMRARLALRACGLPVRLREVVLRQKPAALLALNPAGTVPVLHGPQGLLLLHSLEIMRWAFAKQAPAGWWQPRSPAEVALEAQWLHANDGDFKRALDGYKYPERHPSQSAQDWREQAVAGQLRPLEAQLQSHGQAHVWGAEPGLLDLALWPFVRQFAQVDAAWWDRARGLDAVRAWLRRGLSGPLFESVMDKYPAWQPGDADVLF